MPESVKFTFGKDLDSCGRLNKKHCIIDSLSGHSQRLSELVRGVMNHSYPKRVWSNCCHIPPGPGGYQVGDG